MSPDPAPRTLSPAVREFLDRPMAAVVASVDPDGSPLQAVVWYRLDGDAVVFNSRAGRRWPTNLQRDGRVAFVVADASGYVELRGKVEIDDDPARGIEVISALARRYETDPVKLQASLDRFPTEERVTFRLRPEHILVHRE